MSSLHKRIITEIICSLIASNSLFLATNWVLAFLTRWQPVPWWMIGLVNLGAAPFIVAYAIAKEYEAEAKRPPVPPTRVA